MGLESCKLTLGLHKEFRTRPLPVNWVSGEILENCIFMAGKERP